MKRSKIFINLMLLLLIGGSSFAQPAQESIRVIVAPDHTDWNYRISEEVRFSITVLKSNIPLKEAKISYKINLEKMPAIDSAQIIMPEGKTTVLAKGLNEPGFLNCQVFFEYENKTYSSIATAGFEPFKIKPTCTLPDDFTKFWDESKKQLAQIPVEPVLRELPERCTSKVKFYEVSFNNINGKIFGILCVPRAEGKFPALLEVPGAGVWPFYGDIKLAEKGIITLQIGIHGISVTMDASVYQALSEGALKDYWNFNLDNRDHYYYKRVYLGCVRAVDFIHTLPEFDQENIAVSGGSQGGALSIVTASLDPRIDYLNAFYPALCDLTGSLHHRAGGFPGLSFEGKKPEDAVVKTSAYFDVVNFARFVKVPGFYSWGYNDWVCPPTSTFSAYNSIEAAKELLIVPETQHYTFPEQLDKMNKWVIERLCKPVK